MMKTIAFAGAIALASAMPVMAQGSLNEPHRSVSPAKDGPAASSGQPGTNEYGRGEAASGFQPSTPPGGAGDAGAPNKRY